MSRYTDDMSDQMPDKYSSPTSSGRLLLRSILIVGLILAGIVGAVWYANR